MPSFVYANSALNQWDDVDGQPPSIQLTAPPRPTKPSALPPRSTLAALIAEQEAEQRSPPPPFPITHPLSSDLRSSSLYSFAAPPPSPLLHRLSAALPTFPCCYANRPPASPTPLPTYLSLLLLAVLWLLLILSLSFDSFALTFTPMTADGPTSFTALPTPTSDASTLGAFTFCQAGQWSTAPVNGVDEWTFTPDPLCWPIDLHCTAGGASLTARMGGTGAVACSTFIAFRAWLVLAFLAAGFALVAAVIHLAWPSRWGAAATTALTAFVTAACLIAFCSFTSVLHSSAASSHTMASTSSHLLLSSLLLSACTAVLFGLSEHHRLTLFPPARPIPSSPPSLAIPSSIAPVQLREEVEEWRREHTTSVYSLDEDEGASLEVAREGEGVGVGVGGKGKGKAEEGKEGGREVRGLIGAEVVVRKRKRTRERREPKEKEGEEEREEDHALDVMMMDDGAECERADDPHSVVVGMDGHTSPDPDLVEVKGRGN